MNVFKITLARNNVAPWGWSKDRNMSERFKVFLCEILCKCICWLIIKVIHEMCFHSLWNFCVKFSHFIKNSVQYCYKHAYISMYSACHFFVQFLNKFKFSLHLLTEIPVTKFHENPASGIWVVPYNQAGRQTDKHDKANSPFFCNFVNTPNKTIRKN